MAIDNVEDLFDLIKKLIKDKFFGQLILSFESGRIVLLKKLENIKTI